MWLCVAFVKDFSLFQNTRIKANFGSRAFAYAEGTHHRNAADDCHDVTQEIRETFGALPFHISSDSEGEGPPSIASGTSDGGANTPRTPPGPPCKTPSMPKSTKGKHCEEYSRTCLERPPPLFLKYDLSRHVVFNITVSIALKCSAFCQEHVVLQDRWSLVAVVSQDRFYYSALP